MELNKKMNKENLKTIQSWIDQCPDGGTVSIPAGTWLSGPLHLKSNLTLYLEEGSKILFSNRPEDYLPVVFTRWEGVECFNYSPLIYAKDCEHITISGPGTLDGNGSAWWHWKKLQQNAADRLIWAESRGIAPKDRIFATEADALRPSFMQFIDCHNLILRDFTITNGPQWTIHPVYCSDVTARNLTVLTGGPNTDGFNPDSCENVLIEDCTFSTGDDCIAINSGLNEDGWRVNRPCRNIEICNCHFNGGHASVAIGSGMSGGIENIHVHDCEITQSERGIRVKSMRGRGGYVKNLRFERITMKQIDEEAIQISMNYGSSTSIPASDKAPVFEDIAFCDVTCAHAKRGIELTGLPESPLRNVHLTRCTLRGDLPDKREYVESKEKEV